MSYQFSGQLEDEEVLLFTKQHPFVMLHSLLFGVLIVLIPFFVYIFLALGSLLSYIIVACLVLGTLQIFRAWFAWNNSVLLITNKRVVVLSQKGVLNREMSGSGLSYIHRVTHEVHGLLPSLFHYGTVFIFTDDKETALRILAVAEPFEIQQEILKAVFASKNQNGTGVPNNTGA